MASSIIVNLQTLQVRTCLQLVCMTISAHGMAAGEAKLHRLGVLQNPIPGPSMGPLDTSALTSWTQMTQTASTWWRMTSSGESCTCLLLQYNCISHITAAAPTGLAMQVLCHFLPVRVTGRCQGGDPHWYTCTAFDNSHGGRKDAWGGMKEEVSRCCHQMMDNIGLHDSCQGPQIAEVASEQVNSLESKHSASAVPTCK